jgi:adhesin/invasin
VTATADSRVGSAQVTFLPGPPSALALTARPTSILADGISTAVITATVQDQYDNPVADDTLVAFTTTLGVITPALATTSQGLVTATLTSETQVGRAMVTAQVDSLAETTAVDFLAGPPWTLMVEAFPTSLTADGTSTATITATVRDEWDNPVADGTSVAFTTTLGTIAPTLFTTSQGVATTTLTAELEVGMAEVTATADSRTGSTSVDFTPGPPFTLTVEATPLSIPADGVSTSAISATVRDQWHHPVADDTVVTFTTTLGAFPSGEVYTTTTSGGVATALLTSGTEEGTAIVSVAVDPIPTPGTVEIAFVYHRIYLPLIRRVVPPSLGYRRHPP